jgi:hypothetical protein
MAPYGPTPANASLIHEVNGSIGTLKVAARNCVFAQLFCTIYRIK